ncbi:YeeE/YedE family protein [Vibrio genomosp. F10]|uniref:YeeE/YedE family protein n=2 Tax=Vibrio genomosp. F10 TaxID=723171 RepID=A0A1B9QZD0_9VIBR|nr:YeeE/YedE family protein [Vibrio genomosp. F10]OEE31375.1 YeeE/YedE family protein [Vibrio genomosp. F10 str. ZF-129]OEE96455.1 YeeE/YedE family protein [Vibrio genomosp. F10 str. 9ZC157]OEF05995.1 YeeE/YedE family protein [Vibrio genomosp. F10 str. 9ZD137]OEF10574.1 YeeE/YedE family protein [Vibrio genomosp. F10 str. 9ZB36]
MIVGLISGLLFGAGMVISGMADPEVVTAFLDLTGDWDPSLAFVMGGALFVFTPCYHLIIKKRTSAINGSQFSLPQKKNLDGNLIVGASIFGLGWGLSGICPGPAMSSIAGGSNIILAFVLSMLVGFVLGSQHLAGRLWISNKNEASDDQSQQIDPSPVTDTIN